MNARFDNYFNPKPDEIGKVGAQQNEAILQKMQDRFHYGTIDSLAEAVRYGHEILIVRKECCAVSQKTETLGRWCSIRVSWLRSLGIAAVMVAWSAVACGDDGADTGPWISLFNGKNLEGWTPKIRGYELGENFGNTFRVKDGVLCVSYDQYDTFDGRFGHLFYKDTFSHYVLRLEYRFVGDQCPEGPGWAFRNSGVMLHGQSPESMAKNQDFPVSIEVQMLGGNGRDKRSTGNLCTPGTHVVMDGKLITRHCTDSRSQTFHGDQWVTLEVEVHGNRMIRHIVNGEPVLEYEQPQLDETDHDAQKLIRDGSKMLREGTISLQSESHPLEFRKVEIRVLQP